jgi:hypothetical protein
VETSCVEGPHLQCLLSLTQNQGVQGLHKSHSCPHNGLRVKMTCFIMDAVEKGVDVAPGVINMTQTYVSE